MVRLISFFAIIGPIFGSFTFVLSGAIRVAEFQNQSLIQVLEKLFSGLIGTLIFGIWGLLIAIPIGLIPAGLCGLGFWIVLERFTQTNPLLLKRFLIGGFVSLLFTTSLCFLFYFFSKEKDFFYVWWFFAWPGTVAGAICALFVTNKFYIKIFPERANNAT